MGQKLWNHAAVLIVGIFVGLVVSKWMLTPTISGLTGAIPGSTGAIPELTGTSEALLKESFWRSGMGINATATHGQDNSAIATGLVDNGIEAFYFLDTLTGDLRAAVVNRRNWEFAAFFEYNIQADFGGATKNPKFLMVTGLADLPRGRGPTQIGKSLVYICDATSGQVNAYAVPWNPSLNAAGKAQRGTFQRVAGGSFRTTFIRDE